MSKQISQDGKLLYTITSTDGTSCELVVMPKVRVRDSTMTADGFEELFFSFLKGDTKHSEAFEKANTMHEHYFGKPKYRDYEVFKSSKSQRHKRK
jgi:hypothetical protein